MRGGGRRGRGMGEIGIVLVTDVPWPSRDGEYILVLTTGKHLAAKQGQLIRLMCVDGGSAEVCVDVRLRVCLLVAVVDSGCSCSGIPLDLLPVLLVHSLPLFLALPLFSCGTGPPPTSRSAAPSTALQTRAQKKFR